MKRIASVILSLTLIISVESFGAAYSGGDGTNANPYKIGTVADWQTLMSTPGDWGKQFSMIADVNLAGITVTPIGNSTTQFTGVFDGNDHNVLNAVIDMPDSNNVGLFGYAGKYRNFPQSSLYAIIRNVRVSNLNITGHDNVGGLAGYNYGSSISNSDVSGIVNGNNNVGGLTGNSSGVMRRCYSSVDVSGTSNVGGLSGYSASRISNSFCTGGAAGSNFTGGLAGYVNSSSNISNCYSCGIVTCSGTKGGFVGYTGGTIKACFWDTESSGQDAGAGAGSLTGMTGKTTAEMKALSTYKNAGWSIADLNGIDAIWMMLREGQDYPTLAYFYYHDINPAVNLAGEGTEENPYQITSKEDMVTLSQQYNAWDKNLTLTADIDMNNVGIRPIGNAYVKFRGKFDGQGFVIRNLKIELPSKWLVGLFGYIGREGMITNLGIEDVNVRGKWFSGGLTGINRGTILNCYTMGYAHASIGSRTGGLVGENIGGTIQNCHSDVSVTGSGATSGGIAGFNGVKGKILDCYASGTVTDNEPNRYGSYAGGLVGDNAGKITNSYFTGEVYASAVTSSTGVNAGGIVGINEGDGAICKSYSSGQVTMNGPLSNMVLNGGGLVGVNAADVNDCYSAGDVHYNCNPDSGHCIGGMTGLNFFGRMSRCYSKCPVGEVGNSDYLAGGLTGLNIRGTVYGCFWDTEASGKSISGGGMGMSTEQMKTMGAYQNAGWAGKGWVINEGQDYPRLEWENTGGAEIAAETAAALTGSGTTLDPYQVWTVQDMIEINQHASVLNKKFKLMADLDMSGATIYPIGQFGVFTGEFDGNGHVIRNMLIMQPTNSYVGLFSYLGRGGAINNLSIVDSNVIGGDCAGILIGKNEGGSVSNCSVDGKAAGIAYTGGLIGSNTGSVTKCRSAGTVTVWDANNDSCAGGLMGDNKGAVTLCYATSSVSGGRYGGGLAGIDSNGISTSFATGPVSGCSIGGGFAGYFASGNISTCYSAGRVTASVYHGGFLGNFVYGNSITNCYWDTQTAGQSYGTGNYGNYTGINGCNSIPMKTKSTFSGWDFFNTWAICEGTNYPRLKWSKLGGDLKCPDGVGLADYAVLAGRWSEGDCATKGNCGGTDMDLSGTVDLKDVVIFCEEWLSGGI